ncbi:2OG-Fe dioxygenase family protein [Niveibacterium microcysteis]|uniref:2OG-Fe dioxygenase family protein n=1 Tax=Niveibacterium microcysteis TaxID=2811415 RepID=A0ABX7M5G5_9RHOO|nr:2OG-Fe dioxygenase family protein [Niveibacterium microcysteis]QSI75988.1 2OG-Fe dioxygenase family protein [Niveibacterium microcysteis]
MKPLPPPITAPEQLDAALRTQGFVALDAAGLTALSGATAAGLAALQPGWNNLPPDTFLRDGGRYRFRRHACFVLDIASGELTQTPHRAHWQPVAYNALHGGLERWFEPVETATLASPDWQALLCGLGQWLGRFAGVPQWFIEAHQFRIDTTDGIGRPTPEGAHRDGVDYVAVLLVGREGIKGGETRVFEADGPQGMRFTMTEPWTTLLLDDARVIHESTPIQPLAQGGHRDTLVLTFRRGGFQGPGNA